ncbi:choline dehydrogenase [Verticillium alfalfae VaMs.102]|uniref:Choline dehydrogenase n=1 Tax=Verticillium alfalfae (strain VaMs.102 / ATCC MYA-4576 / FGSC 10136) TaxID=526221 RepID=C9SYQ3_VERA1|nr:choline dehydrogenase [Verticillium alfalfae VaMs.102]EEY23918.1 choline dehydrogenase [Verticillium alfalfae VaMs.102]
MVWPFSPRYPEKTVADVDGKTFDYIVVGGGTAACVLAARLSEDPSVTVLVLSRGKIKDDWLSSIPLLSQGLQKDGPQVSVLYSEPDERWDGAQVHTYTSRALGGASRINGLMLTKGTPGLYDSWAACGNDKWSFKECEPYFRKMENASLTHRDAPGRGQHADKTATMLGTLATPKEIAIKRQGHLTICGGAVATRLEVNQDGSEVTGVYVVDGTHPARKCLMRIVLHRTNLSSGIGPKPQLAKHNIPVIRDMPGVGANLKDHISFGVAFEVLPSDSWIYLLRPLVAIWSFLVFVIFKTGYFASITTQYCIFIRSGAIDDETMEVKHFDTQKNSTLDAHRQENIPDIEYILCGHSMDEDYDKQKGYYSLYVTLLQPFSSGHIELASDDPLTNPKMYHPFVTDDRDWAVTRKATRFAMHFIERFRTTGYPFEAVWHRAPGVRAGTTQGSWRDATDAEIDKFVKKRIRSTLHATSTCRMAKEEEGGVVGQDLKVHGFRNLRVADASVFPRLPSAHTVAATYMVAERCADFVKTERS